MSQSRANESSDFKTDSKEKLGNFFMIPNAIFCIGLNQHEIAIYFYLLRCENRKTYKCYPSFRTIGKATKMSRTTVMKYVRSLEDKCLITTEHTTVITKDDIARNGTLMYHILPIQCAIDEFHRRQLANNGIRMKH